MESLLSWQSCATVSWFLLAGTFCKGEHGHQPSEIVTSTRGQPLFTWIGAGIQVLN